MAITVAVLMAGCAHTSRSDFSFEEYETIYHPAPTNDQQQEMSTEDATQPSP